MSKYWGQPAPSHPVADFRQANRSPEESEAWRIASQLVLSNAPREYVEEAIRRADHLRGERPSREAPRAASQATREGGNKPRALAS